MTKVHKLVIWTYGCCHSTSNKSMRSNLFMINYNVENSLNKLNSVALEGSQRINLADFLKAKVYSNSHTVQTKKNMSGLKHESKTFLNHSATLYQSHKSALSTYERSVDIYKPIMGVCLSRRNFILHARMKTHTWLAFTLTCKVFTSSPSPYS